LEDHLRVLTKTSVEAQRQLSILEWLPEAEVDIAGLERELAAVLSLQERSRALRFEIEKASKEEAVWTGLEKLAHGNLEHRARLNQLLEEMGNLRGIHHEIESRMQDLRSSLGQAEAVLAEAERLEPLRARGRSLRSSTEQWAVVDGLATTITRSREELDLHTRRLQEAERLLAESTQTGKITRLWRGLPDPAAQAERVNDLRGQVGSAAARLQFGDWGGEPFWRCSVNPRHRQRVGKNHLKLPKMRAMIPARDLRKLERELDAKIKPAKKRRTAKGR
jgi:hypothetical protein